MDLTEGQSYSYDMFGGGGKPLAGSTMYSYGQVESALARVHGIPTDAIGAFRARIKHFQKIGIVPSSPGKGRRIDYSLRDIFLWGFALELAEFGIDPVVIKKSLFSDRPDLLEVLFDAFDQSQGQAVRFFFHPTLLRNGVPAPVAMRSKEKVWGNPLYLWGIFAPDLSHLDPYAKEAGEFDSRLGIINIGRLRQKIEIAVNCVQPSSTHTDS